MFSSPRALSYSFHTGEVNGHRSQPHSSDVITEHWHLLQLSNETENWKKRTLSQSSVKVRVKIQCKCNKFYSQDMMTQFFVTHFCFSNICSARFQHYIDLYILRSKSNRSLSPQKSCTWFLAHCYAVGKCFRMLLKSC